MTGRGRTRRDGRVAAVPTVPGARAGGRLPDVALAVAAVALVGNAVLDVLGRVPLTEYPWLLTQAIGVSAAIVVRRYRPDHPLSPWFAVMMAAGAVGSFLAAALNVVAPLTAEPWRFATATFGGHLIDVTGSVAAAHVIGLFADGQAHRTWERRVLRSTWALLAIPVLASLSSPTVMVPWFSSLPDTVANPLGVVPLGLDAATLASLVDLANATGILVGLVLLVARYRRFATAPRRRVRWLLMPLVVLAAGLVLNLLAQEAQQDLISTIFVLVPAVLSVSIALGLVEPRGLDPDRVLRRAIAYGVLWLAIAGAYVAAASTVGLTAGRTLPVEWAVGLAVLATLVFQPVRRGLERVADRWVFGSRTDPAHMVARLGTTLAATMDLDDLLPRMAATLEEGLGLEWARVRLDVPEEVDPDVALAVPIVLGDRQLGVVECGPRRGGPLTDDDRAVVETLAHQASLAVHNVRLATELKAHARELAASRGRLARAQEAERRRIERNIHDGVQQDLVALIGRAGRAQHLHDRDPATAAAELASLREGLQRVLVDLRELAAGIHPSVLSDRGLLAAVEALASRSPVPATVRAAESLQGLRLPAEIEGAAYFTVAEAMANSLKHARAQELTVTLARSNGSLLVSVADDGVGFSTGAGRRPDAGSSGQGLGNLSERLAAVGGRLDIDSAPGRGTVVTATLGVGGDGT
jgi:signal transduction histidine kinase